MNELEKQIKDLYIQTASSTKVADQLNLNVERVRRILRRVCRPYERKVIKRRHAARRAKLLREELNRRYAEDEAYRLHRQAYARKYYANIRKCD